MFTIPVFKGIIIVVKVFLRFKERLRFMNLAKISSNGQITVPIEIRRSLGLKSGDKILFFQKPTGEIVLTNASADAIHKAQAAFIGAADDMGIWMKMMFRIL